MIDAAPEIQGEHEEGEEEWEQEEQGREIEMGAQAQERTPVIAEGDTVIAFRTEKSNVEYGALSAMTESIRVVPLKPSEMAHRTTYHLAGAQVGVAEEWVPKERGRRGAPPPCITVHADCILAGFAAEQLTEHTGSKASRWQITYAMQATAREQLILSL
eukprot:SAG31_NODE_6872_length_1864_cov_3.712181_2_plen_159_part_00